jgi:hypothetical protein
MLSKYTVITSPSVAASFIPSVTLEFEGHRNTDSNVTSYEQAYISFCVKDSNLSV